MKNFIGIDKVAHDFDMKPSMKRFQTRTQYQSMVHFISIVVLSRLSLKCFENTSAAKVNICQLYFTSNGLRFIISIYLFIISFGAVCVCCPLVSFRYYVCVHTTYLSGNNRFLYFIIIDILFGNLELSVPMRQYTIYTYVIYWLVLVDFRWMNFALRMQTACLFDITWHISTFCVANIWIFQYFYTH